jgi:hypothetical protein
MGRCRPRVIAQTIVLIENDHRNARTAQGVAANQTDRAAAGDKHRFDFAQISRFLLTQFIALLA